MSRTGKFRLGLLGPIVVLASTLIVAVGPAAGQSSQTRYPSSMVVLGHSGATGLNSNPRFAGDATENSWATGTNPAVKSVYLRVLARNPAIRGHNANLAEDGATVRMLVAQARRAVALEPKPELVLIQIHDNDIRCDGSDRRRYPAFRRTFASALRLLAEGLPEARLFVVSSAGSIPSYARVLAGASAADRAPFRGSGPCDFYDRSGRAVPKNRAYLQRVVDGYEAQLAAACGRFAQCRYDRGALSRMVVRRKDLIFDLMHYSVSGHARIAAVVWSVLY